MDGGEKINLSDASKIKAITTEFFYKTSPTDFSKPKGVYVVTALDKLSNESKGKKINVKKSK